MFSFLGKPYHSTGDQLLFTIPHEVKAMERAWSLIKKDDIIFDIGAQYGVWTLPAAVMSPKHIYAFEPYKPFYDVLLTNIDSNNEGIRSRITPVNVGFYSRTRHNVPYAEEHVSIYEGGVKSQRLDYLTTIDKYVKENNIEKVNHIKIDVDGPELEILKGAKETLNRFRPNLAIEEHNAIVPNISTKIYKYIVFDLKLPYDVESIGIVGGDRLTAPNCRHTLYYTD